MKLEGIAFGLEDIAMKLEAIAFGLEDIGMRLEAIAFGLEAIALSHGKHLLQRVTIHCISPSGPINTTLKNTTTRT